MHEVNRCRWKKNPTIAKALLEQSVVNLHLSKDKQMTQRFVGFFYINKLVKTP